jgi:hypothetical protein
MKKPGEFKNRKLHHKMVAENHLQIKQLNEGRIDSVEVHATEGTMNGTRKAKLFKCIVKRIDDNKSSIEGVFFSRGHRMFILDSWNENGKRVSDNYNFPYENCVGELVSKEEVKVDFTID